MESPRMKRLRECGLIDCLKGTGITSKNYKKFLYSNSASWRAYFLGIVVGILATLPWLL
jgi:hypothetical protein